MDLFEHAYNPDHPIQSRIYIENPSESLPPHHISSIQFYISDTRLGMLEYSKDDVLTLAPDYQIFSLRLSVHYYKVRIWADDHIKNYPTLTHEDLDHFNLILTVTVTTPISGSSIYPSPISNSSIRDFNICVKRGLNSFQIFNNEINWSYWKDHTINTINSQHVDEVIDPLFVHIIGDAID